VTESVTLRDMDRGSRSTGRKGFSPEINLVLLSFMSSSSSSVLSCGEMVRVPFRHRVQDLDALRELMRGQILVQDLGVEAFFLDRG